MRNGTLKWQITKAAKKKKNYEILEDFKTVIKPLNISNEKHFDFKNVWEECSWIILSVYCMHRFY